MADTTTAAKTEVKTEARTEAKDATATDAGSGKETESSTSDAPTGYSRGENQKPVTDAYRNNWDPCRRRNVGILVTT
jgi:hypothetical protein